MKRNRLLPYGIALLVLWGCDGGGGTGTLKVSLTDAATCGFDNVFVTVAKLRVHQSATADENASGWTDITLSPPRKIDLTALVNGVLEDLGQTALPAGHYTQLRLVLTPDGNSVVISGTEIPVETPSGIQTGIKLIHQFDVAEDTLVDLVLDFDACRSIVTRGTGEYSLKPVISVIPLVVGGQIAGVVDTTLIPSNPMIFAEQGGAIVKSTVPNEDGSFILGPLQQSSTAGSYDVVVTADGFLTAVIESVPVTAQTTTTVSDLAGPITPGASVTHSVSGTATPVAAEASLRAIQTFSSGPIVTVRSTSANLADGTYSLLLPIGAPLLGNFGSGILPITLTADSSIAGTYTLEASASGYQTQTTPINLTGGDVTQDFSLSP
jgi:hypothetical protein